MSQISILAVDLAKNSFQVCGARSDGVVVLRRSVPRARLVQLLSDQVPCVAMEACATSHHRGHVAMAHGHEERAIPAICVNPFAKRQKNDFADATGPAPVSFRFFESKTRHQGDRIWQRYTVTSSSGMRFA